MSEKQEIRKSGQCLRREVRPGECCRPLNKCAYLTTKDRVYQVGQDAPLWSHRPGATPEGGGWYWSGDAMRCCIPADSVVDLVPSWDLPDAAQDSVLLDRYTGLQREHSKLSAADKARASELWSAALRAKIAASKAEDERKERERLVCDDDRWEIG